MTAIFCTRNFSSFSILINKLLDSSKSFTESDSLLHPDNPRNTMSKGEVLNYFKEISFDDIKI